MEINLNSGDIFTTILLKINSISEWQVLESRLNHSVKSRQGQLNTFHKDPNSKEPGHWSTQIRFGARTTHLPLFFQEHWRCTSHTEQNLISNCSR